MDATFQRLQERNLTVNRDKCEFLQDELIYMGHTLSAQGVAPDQSKINTILSLKPPTNVKELRSFLGMITYCSKFIPNFTTLTDSLRQLLKTNVPWTWNKCHENSFKTLQELLISSDTLAYFNPTAPTNLVTDASPIGLGAVISQLQTDGSWRPISYASRSLTPVEQRYSQIERESLAILFAIQRFRMYLYGIKFTVYTDHKPLISMFSSTKCQLPPRIERWITRLMPYNFKVLYLPGSKNSADFLSRSNPLPDHPSCHRNIENYINLIATNSVPISLPLTTIQAETQKDDILSTIKEWSSHQQIK